MYDYFPISDRAKKMRETLLRFMEDHIYPNESVWQEQHAAQDDPWQAPPMEVMPRSLGEVMKQSRM